MRLEWLEDILAVLETGSFNRAAEQRLLTQPAFSRRIKAIEHYVGVDLFDRSRKPAQLKQVVRDQQQRMQELVGGLRDLVYEFKRQDRETHKQIVIASQHAIAATVAPDLVRRLSSERDISVRLRSANRDECYALLVTKQADVALMYRTPSDPLPDGDDFLEEAEVRNERLVPAIARDELQKFHHDLAVGDLAVVAYPSDVSLGQVLNQEILPAIDADFIRKKAETALTLAALQMALSGVGVAWVPQSLAANEFAAGSLVDLSAVLPSSALTVVAVRLTGAKTTAEDQVWQAATPEAQMIGTG
jgi:DNA-binding transcriptional LysR family regulator